MIQMRGLGHSQDPKAGRGTSTQADRSILRNGDNQPDKGQPVYPSILKHPSSTDRATRRESAGENRSKILIVEDLRQANLNKELVSLPSKTRPKFIKYEESEEPFLDRKRKPEIKGKLLQRKNLIGLESVRETKNNFGRLKQIKEISGSKSLRKPKNSKLKSKVCVDEMRFFKRKSAELWTKKRNDGTETARDECKVKKHRVNLSAEIVEPKQRKKRRSLFESVEFTMPMTDKLHSLCSLSSSLMGSTQELGSYRDRYEIHTDNSFEGLDEIKQFESMSVRHKVIPEFANILNSPSPSKDSPPKNESTSKIIDSYIRMLHENGSEMYRVSSQNQSNALSGQTPLVIQPVLTDTIEFKGSELMSAQSRELERVSKLVARVQSADQEPIDSAEIFREIQTYLKEKTNSKCQQDFIDQSVAIYLDQNLEQLDFSLVDDGLKKRQKQIQAQRQKDLKKLDTRRKRLSREQCEAEEKKIAKWADSQLEEVNRAEKSFHQGLKKFQEVVLQTRGKVAFKQVKKCNSAHSLTVRQKRRNEPKIRSKRVVETEDVDLEMKRVVNVAEFSYDIYSQDEPHQSGEIEGFKLSDKSSDRKGLDLESLIQQLQVDPFSEVPGYGGRRLNEEEKQDIFEFIFMDLCIEITEDTHNSILVKLYQLIASAKKPKGFKTDSSSIKDYLFELITYLKNAPTELNIIHANMDKSLGPTALEILHYMHEDGGESFEEESLESAYILNIKLFEEFEEVALARVELGNYYAEEEKELRRKIFVKNAIHIHNKAIFDAFNQTLDKYRPFGIWGQPFAWKKCPKFMRLRDGEEKNEILMSCAQKTIEYSAYVCGIMVDKQDSKLKGNPNVNEALIDHIRNQRVSKMLAHELIESQEKMLFIDDEETEILVEIAQGIFKELLVQGLRECQDDPKPVLI